jgi:hypothetical protein
MRLMTTKQRVINVTIPTITLGLGGIVAHLLWAEPPKADSELTALVTKICTQQTDARLTDLEQTIRLMHIQLVRADSINAVQMVALCKWGPAVLLHRAQIQC